MKAEFMPVFFSKKRDGLPGFSLFESLLSLFMLGLLFVIGAQSLFIRSPRHYLEKAVWEIRTRMNQARYRAIFEETKFRVVISRDFCGLDKYDTAAGAWTRTDTGFLDGVSCSANNTPVFHPAGTVSNLASIRIWNVSGAYKITLAISGRIKAIKL